MTSAPITRRDVGLRSERGPILLALMLATGLIAIDATILATAVTSVTDDLGEFSSFPWLFSIYLLATAVSVPIWSKLADAVGRKPMLLAGIGLFLLGSILCGSAPTMTTLIVFRAVQGLGGGAILPIAITVAGDIYTIAERAKAQGYLASVWAISSVLGPTLGGLFSQFVSWRWIFFVNIPIAVVAAFLVVRGYHETAERSKHRIDYAGAGVLTLGLTSLLLGLLEGGVAWPWASWQSGVAFGIAVVALVVFVLVERHASEPVLPLWVLSRRLLLTTTLMSIGVGVVVTGLTSFVPNYLERSAGAKPLVAGLAVAALTLGWPVAASNAGRIYLRVGFRPTALLGCALTAVGALLLVLIAPLASVVLVAIACLIVGFGLGLVATPSLIAAQSSVGYNDRGVVTGTNVFARSVGSAVGVAVFGAVANGVLAADADRSLAVATASATQAVFVGTVIAGVLALVVAVLMPHVRPDGTVVARSRDVRTAEAL